MDHQQAPEGALVTKIAQRYRTKVIVVEAYQAKNTGTHFISGQAIWAREFQWVLQYEDGSIAALDDADFSAHFEPMPAL